ncbi:MAG TPA: DinB family protein [Candidatus Sulfotelmatobacter sp.]|nr:DinB family protein [Candidatus Sulfotelmatobacter sp.]
MTSPDPVAAPSEYQAMLLALLGDDDPLLAQAATVPNLRAVLDEVPAVIRQRPEPAEWSILEVAGHILDAEIVSSGRYRFILAHDMPRLPGYDQDLWVDRLHHNEDDPADLLAQFTALRAANLALWQRTSPLARDRVGLHEERGPESYELTFRLIAGHDRFHLAQARRTLAAVRPRDA